MPTLNWIGKEAVVKHHKEVPYRLLEPVSKGLGVLANAWSRRHEFEADAYAAKVTGNGAALGEALKKMTADHLSHPSPAPLRVWLDYSHPPLVQRLEALLPKS